MFWSRRQSKSVESAWLRPKGSNLASPMRGSVFCHLWQNLIRAQSARSARTSPAIMGNKRQHQNEHIFDKISFKCKPLSNTVRSRRQISYVHILDCSKRHITHGCRTYPKRKKCTMEIFFIFVHKNVYTGCPKKGTFRMLLAYLIIVIFLHWHNFWRIKFAPKNANFSR